MNPEEVLSFWFEETPPQKRFTKDEALDAEICERFLSVHEQASVGALEDWRTSPRGRLAEVVVLDQFSRNMFRDTPRAFAYDEQALALAREARARGDDKKLSGEERYFMYLPYMHSESPSVHREAVWLFLSLPVTSWWSWLRYELAHKKIIDRFGRYAHRNQALGRVSTPEEERFLAHHSGF